jgi:Glu-tRNA(Gln) amidotransferase subunit E-like FAD-binding protein
MRSLIHPYLRHAIPQMWPSRCTIQLVTSVADVSGQIMQTGASNVRGMVNIPCRLGPIIEIRPSDNEVRTQDVQESYVRRQLKLNAYLPQIRERVHQAVVDGEVYPIMGVESDSEKFSTRLKVERVSP